MGDPLSVLQTVFGYDDFRPLQREIIDNVLNRRDTLAIMPTGGGKSMCFQIPALIFDGLTLVVSPLISLMQDQVRSLRGVGVDAAMLNSSLPYNEYRDNVDAVKSGRAKLLYLAPETLLTDRTMSVLSGLKLSCIAVDEAHCISEWGHDFRPEYRDLMTVRSRFPDAVCIGLTATATPRVREDIARQLTVPSQQTFVASFDRPNLSLRSEERDGGVNQLLQFIKGVDGSSGIVYCGTRKSVDNTAQKLKSKGLSVRPYHAGMSDRARRDNQEAFVRDDLDIIVATVAFGMGIDKPDVRFVAHMDMPKNLETYYQAIGRAGRDGLPSDCLLLWSDADLAKIEFFIQQKRDTEQRVARSQLNEMRAFAEAAVCRRRPLLAYFGEEYAEQGCGNCDNCINPPPDLRDMSEDAKKFLSCVFRTGQRFGAGHVTDVLRGSKSKKILQLSHDKLSTYGIGAEHDATQWRHIARQLVQHGLLYQDVNWGTLSLTAAARPVLMGEDVFKGRLRRKAKKSAGRSRARTDAPTNYDKSLFQTLRALRKSIADRDAVPPYVVFSDRSLMEMADKLPRNRGAMLDIHGVGDKKFDRYGAIFMQRIAEFTGDAAEPTLSMPPGGGDVPPWPDDYDQGQPWPDEYDAAPADPFDQPSEAFPALRAVPEPPRVIGLASVKAEKKHKASRRARIAERLSSGASVSDVLAEERLKRGTVLQHMEDWVSEGGELAEEPIRLECALDGETLTLAFGAFRALGIERLKPVREALGGEVDWEDLRLARILYRIQHP